PFDIALKMPRAWLVIKIVFLANYFFVSIILINKTIEKININKIEKTNKKDINNDKLINNKKIKTNKKIINNNYLLEEKNNKNNIINLLIGIDNNNNKIFIPEKGLYQNILVTGTIGTGKTSSAMYPITEQLIKYNSYDKDKKIGMLILDVKGNYYKKVKEYTEKYNRNDDLIIIEINGKYKYNPLDKNNIKASVLANRLKIIMELFSGNTSESYWIDKSEQILCEAIKLCRLYNNGYVSFEEIHNLIINKEYYEEKIKILKNKFSKNEFNKEEKYNLLSSLNFFEKEFLSLDSRSLALLKSQITRITSSFISDYNILNTFSPKKSSAEFSGIKDIINEGKIVVLNMNIAEYKNLSKIIAAYLKLDFQAEVMFRLSNGNNDRTVAFISDEYHEYITETDADFYAQSREAKCINVVATQSYKSLLKTLKDEAALSVVTQNLINKIWFRTDDIFTIEEAQKQIGKEEKEKVTKSISENAKETTYSYVRDDFKSKDSSISESINSSYEKDYIFDSNFFTQELETFSAVVFLSDGNKIIKPQKIKLIPYFKKGSDM
ncbi:MAG: type IV secretion system DNA-binding domain-containing protein, partial [Clostridia bacterium]|nr:type IV secretion system DNA-binding domain-containing protein [Clostridia bacterium]